MSNVQVWVAYCHTLSNSDICKEKSGNSASVIPKISLTFSLVEIFVCTCAG